ncbi:MAG: LemA family protein [Candidatus Izemoplasmatales bacterium]
MRKISIIIISITVLLALIVTISLITGYNNIIDKDESIKQGYSEIDRRLQQRYDTLIPLAEAVNGFQDQERVIYDMITSARQAYAEAKANDDIQAMIEADALQSIALTNLLALIEDNPSINSLQAYQTYMDAVWGIESALSEARRQYNNAVAEYNRYVRKFPGLLYKNLYDFTDEFEYWRVQEGADQIPDITFGD